MREVILIVGSGAREHAIAVALARSPQKPLLICYGSARNPGVALLCAAYTVGSIVDASAVAAFATEHGATLAVIGPEAPLAAGVADALWRAGVPTVGPTQDLARLESSKTFTRELLVKYSIPGNPAFQRFTSMEGVEEMLARFPQHYVIKEDGLAGGKGVKVYGDHLHSLHDSLSFCNELLLAGRAFVIEEKLEGEEFSLLCFCDGDTVVGMPLVQDHKRAYAGDLGPNTGGMGSYSDTDHRLPFVTLEDVQAAQTITELVAAALKQECGRPYLGVLYGGFMLTTAGVRLIEYNARFGDPECLNLLSLLQSDFVEICRAIADRRLADVRVEFGRSASVCKYVVPEGYPDTSRRDDAVQLPALLPAGISLFLGAVDEQEGKLVSTGSRTAAVVAAAPSLAEAEALCESVVARIPGPFVHREDIGTAALIERRVQHMISLRCS